MGQRRQVLRRWPRLGGVVSGEGQGWEGAPRVPAGPRQDGEVSGEDQGGQGQGPTELMEHFGERK